QVELVPAALARVAAQAARRARSLACSAGGRVMTLAPVFRPFADSRTYKGLVYLATPLVLSGLWLAVLITIWTLTAVVAITPLVIPALISVGWTIRGGAAVEAALSRWLLGAEIDLPKPPKV